MGRKLLFLPLFMRVDRSFICLSGAGPHQALITTSLPAKRAQETLELSTTGAYLTCSPAF